MSVIIIVHNTRKYHEFVAPVLLLMCSVHSNAQAQQISNMSKLSLHTMVIMLRREILLVNKVNLVA